MSGYLKEGVRYFKPLSPNDELLIKVLTTRYEGVAAAFIAIDREDHVELRVPETIRRSAPYEKANVKTEAPALHGLPIGTGGSNGNSN